MRIADADILILPGLGNSGAGHWQRRWAERFSTGRIVEQDDWDNPDIRDWTAAMVEAVEMAERPVVLIAHSLAVSALAAEIGSAAAPAFSALKPVKVAPAPVSPPSQACASACAADHEAVSATFRVGSLTVSGPSMLASTVPGR